MRKSIMTKAIQYFEDNKNDILEILTLESGSTAVKANLEFDLTTGLMEESLKMVDKVGKFEEKPSIIPDKIGTEGQVRSEEHTSELQSRGHLVCRLLLEKKKQ